MLSVGVEAALKSLANAVKRDGYDMNAIIALTSIKSGDKHLVTWGGTEWHETCAVDGGELK